MHWLLNLPVALWRRLLLIGQGIAALLVLIGVGLGALFGRGGSVGDRLKAAAADLDIRFRAESIGLFESLTGGGPAR